MQELFPGVYSFNGKICTLNAIPGTTVYGEKLFSIEGKEFREWVPFRSKLAAAIKNGLKEMPIKAATIILYLGCAEGTTVSHISEIVGAKGIVFGLDVSARSMSEFIQLAEQRNNIVPILADANKPETYAEYLKGLTINVLFQDIAQKNQAEIFCNNARAFLKKGAFGLLTIKAKSINQEKRTATIIEEQARILEKDFEILQIVSLAPFEKDHALVYCRKK
jgi:fibrillarin-like pre-rRNA processing protein